MSNWHDQRYTAHRHDHERDYRKHEPRAGEPDFPIRLETAPIKGALEIAILAQAVPVTQAAELIERYVAAECAAARLDAVSATIDRCVAEIDKHGGKVDA